jgi:hypothetical protein
MNVLDDIEQYTKLKNSIDSHYTRVASDDIVKKSELAKVLDNYKIENKRLIEENKRIIDEQSKKVDEHKNHVTTYKSSFDKHKSDFEEHAKKMDDYHTSQILAHKQVINQHAAQFEHHSSQIEAHKQTINNQAVHIDEQKKVFENYKKITDERIEKLVKLFLSINK